MPFHVLEVWASKFPLHSYSMEATTKSTQPKITAGAPPRLEELPWTSPACASPLRAPLSHDREGERRFLHSTASAWFPATDVPWRMKMV